MTLKCNSSYIAEINLKKKLFSKFVSTFRARLLPSMGELHSNLSKPLNAHVQLFSASVAREPECLIREMFQFGDCLSFEQSSLSRDQDNAGAKMSHKSIAAQTEQNLNIARKTGSGNT